MLDKATFLQVVDKTPLVSVDLIVVRDQREVLLGFRNNRPAQGFWFVPGGRVLKNEKIDDALRRVAGAELGLPEVFAFSPRLLGVFQHFCPDSFAGDLGIPTHYVVLAHRLDVPADFSLPQADDQHREYRWWSLAEAASHYAVHRYTRDYFSEG
jgi:colanic acid biosynthesis protein WcaH